ncbi:hypothetical protein Hanom_Chr11g00968901 [Helianthus anomalus]
MQRQDAPWRAASSTATKSLPKIHLSPLLSLPQNPHTDYALSLSLSHQAPGSDLIWVRGGSYSGSSRARVCCSWTDYTRKTSWTKTMCSGSGL